MTCVGVCLARHNFGFEHWSPPYGCERESLGELDFVVLFYAFCAGENQRLMYLVGCQELPRARPNCQLGLNSLGQVSAYNHPCPITERHVIKFFMLR